MIMGGGGEGGCIQFYVGYAEDLRHRFQKCAVYLRAVVMKMFLLAFK